MNYQGSATQGFANGDAPTDYSPYGEPLNGNPATGHQPSQFEYRNERYLDKTLYLRNRLYDPAIGQFTSRDPLDGVDGSPDVTNPYHYVSNSPLNATDPLGLYPNPTDALFMSNGQDPLVDAVSGSLRDAGLADCSARDDKGIRWGPDDTVRGTCWYFLTEEQSFALATVLDLQRKANSGDSWDALLLKSRGDARSYIGQLASAANAAQGGNPNDQAVNGRIAQAAFDSATGGQDWINDTLQHIVDTHVTAWGHGSLYPFQKYWGIYSVADLLSHVRTSDSEIRAAASITQDPANAKSPRAGRTETPCIRIRIDFTVVQNSIVIIPTSGNGTLDLFVDTADPYDSGCIKGATGPHGEKDWSQ